MQISTMSRLADKTAIIFGGGQIPGETIGNGRATAITFAREGARVALVDRNLQSAEETAHMVVENGGDALAIQGDVCNENDCQRAIAQCHSRFERIDILHNNVGTGDDDAGPVSITLDAWKKIFDVNLNGMLSACKHVLPIMQSQNSGCIINMSSIISQCSDLSVAGSSVNPDADEGQIAYKTSKAAINTMTESMAISQAPYGIRVNAILPGLMDTPTAIEALNSATGVPRDELRALRAKQVPLGQVQGTAWDVANAALFLASDEAKFVTGVLLRVDGGQTLRRG